MVERILQKKGGNKMSNFVILSKAQFEEILPSNYRIVDLQGVKEYVYEVDTSNPNINVRIYSTVDTRTGQTRDIGMDAIRIVFWDKINSRPVGKGKKILRVEKRTSISDRIKERIDEFMNSASSVEIVNFDYIKAVLNHDSISWMDFAKSLADGLADYGSLTDKQLDYVIGVLNPDGTRSNKNPKGKMSMEARVLQDSPNFKVNYISEIRPEELEVDYEQEMENETVADLPPDMRPKPIVDSIETIGETMEVNLSGEHLAPTIEYEAHRYPFDYFNPVQTAVLPHKSEDKNMVIGANTSAGKTIAAEFLIDETLARDERVIYLSPLKSLTQEKYSDWQVRYPNEEITILTGDYVLSERMKKQLDRSRIIVMTSEMCDSRTRRMKSEKNFWLLQVGLVVVDEAHILSTNRGHAVEAGLMRFTKINPHARILLLSATMPNVNQLGEWLSILNNKETTVVYSTWRPVVLQKRILEYPIQTNNYGYEDYWTTQANKLKITIDLVMAKPNEKFLIFCHDKNTGSRVVNKLKENGIETHFHNADLDLEERLEIESSFQSRENGLRVLVSTSTLAWGRNLPARNVIIVGIHRGLQEIDELDVIQMAGRAGRYGIDDEGFVFLLVPPYTIDHWLDVFENPRPVNSVMFDRPTLAFHVLAEIEAREVKSSTDIFSWYSRSLAFYQNLTPFTEGHSQALEEELSKMEMIKTDRVRISITGLGRVSSWLYYSPYDVWRWYSNFDQYFNGDARDDETLSWAIGDIPSFDLGYIPRDLEDIASSYAYSLRSKGCIASSAILSAIACHEAITAKEAKPGTINNLRRQIVYDISRMSQALKLIDVKYAKWNSPIWNTLAQRVKYGVSEEVAVLTYIPGVGGKRAKQLWDAGFTSLEKIADVKSRKKLNQIFTPVICKKIRLGAKKLVEA